MRLCAWKYLSGLGIFIALKKLNTPASEYSLQIAKVFQ